MLKQIIITTFTFAALLLLSSTGMAGEQNRVTLGLGFTNGGDTLAKATLVSSTNGSQTESIKAGGEMHIFMGMQVPATPTVDTSFTLGYHFDDITAQDGSVKFSRLTLDAIPSAQFGRNRLGMGVTYHFSTKYSESGAAGNNSVKFDNSLGYVISGTYLFSMKSGLEIRYTSIDYKITELNGFPVSSSVDIDGSNWGVYWIGYF